MNSEEINQEQRAITPQERTGISLLNSFEPDVWVVVDGGHPAPLNAVGSGAGVVVLQRELSYENSTENVFNIRWEHFNYSLEDCNNSTDAEIWSAVKGLEKVADLAGKKRIALISDNVAVTSLQTRLLIIEMGLKNAQRYAKDMELSPLRDLADLYLRSQPCQLLPLQGLQPQGFNLLLIAAHQAAHELATNAGLISRQS